MCKRAFPHLASSTARGYTAIEVLMAMTVMAIGGAAVITMQKTSVTGNLDARKADVANAIARTWVERLQRDAMAWTLPGPDGIGSNIANARIINDGIAGVGANGQWFLPNIEMGAVPETASPGFDILGRDLPQAALGSADFCVHVRLTWLTQAPSPQDFIRADVRVVWPIGIVNSYPGFCNQNSAQLADPNTDPAATRDPNADPAAPVFHTLYVTTSIKENTAQ
jgi:prepilin-type N-terminal cleavage/methylation domain-containing protein